MVFGVAIIVYCRINFQFVPNFCISRARYDALGRIIQVNVLLYLSGFLVIDYRIENTIVIYFCWLDTNRYGIEIITVVLIYCILTITRIIYIGKVT